MSELKQNCKCEDKNTDYHLKVCCPTPSVGLAEYADKVVEEFKNKFTFEGDNGEDTMHMLFCNHGTHKSIAKDTDIIDFLRTAILRRELEPKA